MQSTKLTSEAKYRILYLVSAKGVAYYRAQYAKWNFRFLGVYFKWWKDVENEVSVSTDPLGSAVPVAKTVVKVYDSHESAEAAIRKHSLSRKVNPKPKKEEWGTYRLFKE